MAQALPCRTLSTSAISCWPPGDFWCPSSGRSATFRAKSLTIDAETQKALGEDVKRDVETIQSWQRKQTLSPEDVGKAANALKDLDVITTAFPDLIRYAISLGLRMQDVERANEELRGQMRNMGIHANPGGY